MKNKVYAVITHGGEYEDSWEDISGICSTSEIAETLKSKIEEQYDESKLSITRDEWEQLYEAVVEKEVSEDVEYESVSDGIVALFPNYNIEDLKKAEAIYEGEYKYTTIEEINFYDDISEI